MPSVFHEAPLAVFREKLDLVPALLRDAMGVAVPDYDEVELADADFTQVVPAELRADLVLVLRDASAARLPVMGIVVEVQRSRDPRKRGTWPLYLAALHARLACPTCLVVVATDEDVAAWAAEPILTLHPGLAFAPLVLGPAQIPRMTAPDAAAHPWLVVLSALIHGNRPGGVEIARVAIETLIADAATNATLGIKLIMATLDASVRRTLEAYMGSRASEEELQRSWARVFREIGREEGKSMAVRHMIREFAARKAGEPSPAQLARIEDCEDVVRLERVLMQVADAADAATVAQLLDGL